MLKRLLGLFFQFTDIKSRIWLISIVRLHVGMPVIEHFGVRIERTDINSLLYLIYIVCKSGFHIISHLCFYVVTKTEKPCSTAFIYIDSKNKSSAAIYSTKLNDFFTA